jgi:hypothetical protein
MTSDQPSEETPKPPNRRLERLKAWGRIVLLLGGIGFIGYLVYKTGPRQVAGVLLDAGPYIPLIILFEAAMLVTDSVAFSAILGPRSKNVSVRGWVRSSCVSFLCIAFLPAGRTASEVARATILAQYTGAFRSATAGAEMQAAALIGDGLISGAVGLGIYAMLGSEGKLAWMLGGNFVLATTLGAGLFLLLHHKGFAAWMKRRFPKVAKAAGNEVSTPRYFGVLPSAWSFAGRWLQVAQYGVAVFAVGGAFGFRGAFVAHGIRMVGATVGAAVPNQVGIVDGAYVAFADELGFHGAPAKALSVALVLRASQLLFALVCVIVASLTREAARPRPQQSDGASGVNPA